MIHHPTRLAGAIVLLGTTSALAIGPHIETCRIEGFLDHAPATAHVIEELQIQRRGVERTLLITEVEAVNRNDGSSACASTLEQHGGFGLAGSDAVRLIEAPYASRVSTTVMRTRQDRHLLVRELTTENTTDAIAGKLKALGRDS